MELYHLLQEAGIEKERFQHLKNITVKGICCDSRRVQAGDIFVALRGRQTDGASFIAEARERGAALIIGERVRGGQTLCVENARAALSALCDAWHGHPGRSLSLIGVTGTNGKTSICAMLEWILQRAGERVGVIGTVATRARGEEIACKNSNALANMTTPDPTELYEILAEMRARNVRFVVMEVTSHALALSKVAPLHFQRAVFSNLTAEHLDFHTDMEAYFAEKKKLFSLCERAVVSHSTPFGKRLCESLECPFFEVSPDTLSDILLKGEQGAQFRLRLGEQDCLLSVPVPGYFSVENAALAATTAFSLGVPPDVIQGALASFPGVRGRMERVSVAGVDPVAFLDYAHTPDALEKLLQAVRSFSPIGARITVLFGCGGDRDRSKRRAMGAIASRLADFVILTSDNARFEDPLEILSEILRGVDKEKPYAVIPDRREAIKFAVDNARQGEILVLAGKGHETYEIRGAERLPFCEREILLACMRDRLGGGAHADHSV